MAFKNWQWVVTDQGLDAIAGASSPSMKGKTPTYEIDAKRLLETTSRDSETFYFWPIQLAEKTWSDIEAFNEAFGRALEVHNLDFNSIMLNNSNVKSIEVKNKFSK